MSGFKKPLAGSSSGTIGLFSTEEGIRAIQSPVRVKILTVLNDRDLSFDEIVRLSGKAKSTVSVHLRGLEQDGIISGKADPKDSRKKIFSIRSSPLGNLSDGIRYIPDTDLDPAIFSKKDPFRFYRVMFRTIRVSLLVEGINIDPVLHDAGFRIGEGIYPAIADTDLPSLLDKTSALWKKNKLGIIEIENESPLIIRVYDCFECGDLPQLGGRPVRSIREFSKPCSAGSLNRTSRLQKPRAMRWETITAGS